jgi:hypothetical protein
VVRDDAEVVPREKSKDFDVDPKNIAEIAQAQSTRASSFYLLPFTFYLAFLPSAICPPALL